MMRKVARGEEVKRPPLTDTDPAILAMQVEIWRNMSYGESAAVVASLNESVDRMMNAGIRQRYPDADEHEVFLRRTALKVGRELVLAAYGWDPEEEGW